ncbi:MAG: alpha/beta hydrolase [Planctomycetes bacterium]|nr:alpha/beta hydrolase [Planctomycetota bacterium]
MSSFRARGAAAFIRLFIRRRNWGVGMQLAKRARRHFGTTRALQLFRSLGVKRSSFLVGEIAVEELNPPTPTTLVLLYLHGGGYLSCSPATHRPITAALARLTPARVLVPDYRLAPEHPFPAALDDAEKVYRWMLDQNIDPNFIGIAGDSAGGGLAVALMHRLQKLALPLPARAVLFSPWTDLTGSGNSVHYNDGKCAMFRPENLPHFAACYTAEENWKNPAVSPLFGELKNLPPIHIQVGDTELLFDDAKRIHDQLLANGGTSEFSIYRDVFHGWQAFDGYIPEARAALKKAANFLLA